MCSKEDDKYQSYHVYGEENSLGKATFIINILFQNRHKIDISKLSIPSVREASQWLIQHIDKHPIAMTAAGLGISIWLLRDSSLDNEAVNRIKEEYDDICTTPIHQFATPADHREYVIKRFTQLRGHIITLKKQQWQTGTLKLMFTVFLGWIGYSTHNPTIKPVAYATSFFCGTAALVNAYNWGELNELTIRLGEHKYLV